MANIYNFGLAGVASQVQFGKGGTQLLSQAGTFQAVAADGSTLVRFQIADPVGGHDAVSLEVLNSALTTVNSNVSTLRSDFVANVTGINANVAATNMILSNTDTAIGLASNGTYIAPTGTTFIGAANGVTTIMGALIALDAAANTGGAGLAQAVSTLTNAISTVNSNVISNVINIQNELDMTAANLTSNVTNLTTAINLVQSNVTANVASLTTLITNNYNIEQADIANTNANLTSNVSTLTTMISNLNANVIDNVSILTTAINGLNANVISNVANLQSELDMTGANLTSNVNTLTTNINTVNANVVNDLANVTGLINLVQSNVTANVATLTSEINLVNSNVVADVATLTADVASNAAVVNNFITVTYATDISATNANVAAEKARALAAEANIATDLVTNVATLNATINTEFVRANAAETVLTNSVVAIQQTYVQKNGSVPFVGNVSMGGFQIQNVASPVANTDAVNLGYLTSAIGALGSAFNYVGVLSTAGANSALAVALPTAGAISTVYPSGAPLAAGDYWKSTVAGWYLPAAGHGSAFFVQANDGIVYNTLGGWDVIAHVDSVINDNGTFTTVTGSVDTGWTVSVDSTFIGYVTTLQGNVIVLANAITAEMQRAVAVETQLNANIVANVIAINANIAGEVTRATTAESTLNTNVINEVTRATTAEGVLNANIVANATMINSNVAALRTDFVNNVTTMNANVANVETAVGLDTNGNYIPPTGTTYLDTTVTVMGALVALDSAANAAANLGNATFAAIYNTINTVQSNVTSNVSTLTSAINLVNSNVVANVATLQGEIDATNANVYSNVVTLTSAIATVNANVISNVINLQSELDMTAANLTSNVNTLTTNINSVNANVVSNVASIRTDFVANVTTINANVAAIETAVGLDTNGHYVAPTGTNFVNGSTSVANAVILLDNAIESVVNTVAHLTQYQIITSDSLAYVRVEDNANGVTTALDINGAAQLVANVVGSTATNTILTTDFTAANTISLIAGGAATNVDVRIEPKGTGQVFIGQTGTPGQISGEPGQTLEVTGGANTSGAGGNLILAGGAGTTTQGMVVINDSTGNAVATFSGVANAVDSFAFINGVGSATMGVQGSDASINLVLAPKGTGVVSVSGAKVQNVQTGVANTDAVNVGQMNTAITTAITTAQTGMVYTVMATITELTGAVAIGAAISGTVIRARVLITNGWNAGSSIVVGTASSASDLMTSSMIDGTLNGNFFVADASAPVSAQTMYATVAASGSGGTATVMIEYIHA